MVWGAVIGAAGSVLGAGMAKSGADSAAKTAARTDKQRLKFEQDRYDDWKKTYGSVEENLSNYYNTLTPELRMTQGLQAFNEERDAAMTKLNENLAQRGISRSGLAAAIETESALQSAETRAQIRANAPMEVAKEKLGFLNAGLASNPANNVGNALADQSRNAGSIAVQAAANSGAATAQAIEAGANLADELADVFTD